MESGDLPVDVLNDIHYFGILLFTMIIPLIAIYLILIGSKVKKMSYVSIFICILYWAIIYSVLIYYIEKYHEYHLTDKIIFNLLYLEVVLLLVSLSTVYSYFMYPNKKRLQQFMIILFLVCLVSYLLLNYYVIELGPKSEIVIIEDCLT